MWSSSSCVLQIPPRLSWRGGGGRLRLLRPRFPYRGRPSVFSSSSTCTQVPAAFIEAEPAGPSGRGRPRLCAPRVPSHGHQVPAHREHVVREPGHRGRHGDGRRKHRARAHCGHDRPHRGHRGHGHHASREQSRYHRRAHGVHGTVLRANTGRARLDGTVRMLADRLAAYAAARGQRG